MNKLFILLLLLTMSGCHVTGHNPYNKPAFNGLVIGVLAVIL